MNSPVIECPVCERGYLTPDAYEDEFQHNGAKLLVHGLERHRCSECNATPILTDQIRRNQAKIANAKREFDALLTSEEILQIRGMLGLSQADAARVFGGGNNAFSKYERSEVIQSVPMDRLLRLVRAMPELVHLLAHMAGTSATSSLTMSSDYVEAMRFKAGVYGPSKGKRAKLVVVDKGEYKDAA
jgi:HTH-type transcriptional regulator / antitoxin MqsA